MAESSLPWSGTVTGHAGPYTDVTWALLHSSLFIQDNTTECVIPSGNMLLVTNPAGVTIRVATGFGMVSGRFYINTANIDFTIAAPGGGSNYYNIVLRGDYVAQTVTAAMLGPNAGGVPTVTQNANVWEVSIATVQITSGSVITITRPRCYMHFNTLGMQLIDEFVGNDADEFNFQNIPQTYRHLLLIASINLTSVFSGWSSLEMRINGAVTANYAQYTWNQPSNASFSAIAYTSGTKFELGAFPIHPAGDYHEQGSAFMLIPNYTVSSFYKYVMSFGMISPGTYTDPAFAFSYGIFSLTDPITSIAQVANVNFNISATSVVSLFGLG